MPVIYKTIPPVLTPVLTPVLLSFLSGCVLVNAEEKPLLTGTDQNPTSEVLELGIKEASAQNSFTPETLKTRQLANGEFTLCEPQSGPWRCPEPTPKTPHGTKLEEPLSPPLLPSTPSTTDASPEPADAGDWFIQLGVYRENKHLVTSTQYLKQHQLSYTTQESNGITKLLLGGFANKTLALQALPEVEATFPDAFIAHLPRKTDHENKNL
jgi:cell division septation protein DedD